MSELQHSPLVAFVILNWNQFDLTADCLRSLQRQDYPNYQVLIVDNGSTDGSGEMIRDQFPWTEVLILPENVGYAKGNNVGIRHVLLSSCEYIFLLNNDTEVASDMLSKLVAVAESTPKAGIIGPTMYYFSPPDVIWSGENHVEWRRGAIRRVSMGDHVSNEMLETLPVSEIDHVDSCAALVRRQVFESIGFMDEDYFISYVDIDFDIRAKRAGFKVLYVPDAMMWHKVSAAMGNASPMTTYYMTRNSLLFFWRHAPKQWKLVSVGAITARTLRTIGAWTIKPVYRNELYQRRLSANTRALRDFVFKRFGRAADI